MFANVLRPSKAGKPQQRQNFNQKLANVPPGQNVGKRISSKSGGLVWPAGRPFHTVALATITHTPPNTLTISEWEGRPFPSSLTRAQTQGHNMCYFTY